MMKKTHIALLVSAAALGAAVVFAQPASAATPKTPAAERAGARIGIAVKVNDEVITFSDIENRTRLYMLGAPPKAPDDLVRRVTQQAINKLIDERLQLQEAKNLGIVVAEQQVDEGLATLAGQNKMSPADFVQNLAKAGVEVGTLREQARAELAWGQVVRRRLRPQIVISESEIDSEMARQSRDAGRTEYRVAEIFLTIDSPANEEAVRRTAERLAEEISKGAPFSQIARAQSQAPGAATGGDLGWIGEGILDARLDAALAALRPGQLSAPIRTDKGYHLVFLRDVRQRGIPAAPQAAATPAAPEAPAPQAAETAETVRLKRIIIPAQAGEPAVVTKVKMDRATALAADISSCAQMDARMKDFPASGTGDMGQSTLDALPADIRQAIEGLAEGTLSRPVMTREGIALVMVCGRTVPAPAQKTAAPQQAPAQPEPTPAPAAGDIQRETVANEMGMKRLEQMAERYLRDLRATAFIERLY